MTEAQQLAEWLDILSHQITHPLPITRAAAHLRRLEAECEQLRQALSDLGVTPEEAKAGTARSTANKLDAARYGYLRSHPDRVSVAVVVQSHWLPAIGEQLDAAIDEAMKETK